MGGCIVPSTKPSYSRSYSTDKYKDQKTMSSNSKHHHSRAMQNSPARTCYQSQHSIKFQSNHTKADNESSFRQGPLTTPRTIAKHPLSESDSDIFAFPQLKENLPQVLNDQILAYDKTEIIQQPIRINNHLITPIPPIHSFYQNRNQQSNNSKQSSRDLKVAAGQSMKTGQKILTVNNLVINSQPRSPMKLKTFTYAPTMMPKNY